jgi:hypothetical protein
MSSINTVCVIWNSLQIAHIAGCGLLGVGLGGGRCRC